MLHAQGDDEMAGRLRNKNKNISEEDLQALTGEKLKGFLDRLKTVETCSSTMTPEAMNKILGGKSKKFEMIVKAVGVEGARNSIVPQLEMLAMKYPDRFKRIAGSFQFLQEKDKEIEKGKGINEAIAKFRDEHKLTEEEYSDIEKESTLEGRIQLLKKKYSGGIEEIKGRRGWFGFGKENEQDRKKKQDAYSEKINADYTEQAKKIQSRVDIENLKSQLESRLNRTGELLGASILENDDINEAFRNILLGQEAPEEEVLGFQDAREIMPDKKVLKEEYDKWAEKETETDESKKKDAFSNHYMGKKTGNKKGFWSDITQKFIKGLLEF